MKSIVEKGLYKNLYSNYVKKVIFMGWFNLAYEELKPYLSKGELNYCIKRVYKEINKSHFL